MPNWCSQYGEVRGSNKELKRFIDAMRVERTAEWEALPSYNRNYWDMNQLFPIPTELHETISGGYGMNEDGTRSLNRLRWKNSKQRTSPSTVIRTGTTGH